MKTQKPTPEQLQAMADFANLFQKRGDDTLTMVGLGAFLGFPQGAIRNTAMAGAFVRLINVFAEGLAATLVDSKGMTRDEAAKSRPSRELMMFALMVAHFSQDGNDGPKIWEAAKRVVEGEGHTIPEKLLEVNNV